MFDFFKRAKVKTDAYYDLDAMLTERVAFKVLGKIHVLEPLSTEKFYKFVKSISVINSLKENSVTAEEFINVYADILEPIIPTLTKKDIRKLTVQQANGIFNFVIETVLGKQHLTDNEKKTLNPPHATH